MLKLSLLCSLILCFSCKPKNDLPDPLLAGWNNQAVCEVLEENDELRILRCTFAPQIGHEKHYHPPHYAYAVQGSRFRIEDSEGVREVDFPTGANYYSEGVEWHQALNIGDSTAVVLIIEPK